MRNYRASHDSVIKSNFVIKKYSTQSVGLRARLPQEEEAEEWRPGGGGGQLIRGPGGAVASFGRGSKSLCYL